MGEASKQTGHKSAQERSRTPCLLHWLRWINGALGCYFGTPRGFAGIVTATGVPMCHLHVPKLCTECQSPSALRCCLEWASPACCLWSISQLSADPVTAPLVFPRRTAARTLVFQGELWEFPWRHGSRWRGAHGREGGTRCSSRTTVVNKPWIKKDLHDSPWEPFKSC